MSFRLSATWASFIVFFFCFLSSLLFGQSPVYVVNGGSATVSAIDSSGNVTTIPISPGSGRCSGGDLPPAGFTVTTAAVSPDGARLYVLVHQTNSVAVFDTTNTPATQLGSVPVGNCPDTMTISSDGTRLYVAETGAGTVGVIDTTLIGTNAQAEIADIPVGGEPFGVTSTPDGKRLWVADELNSGVDIIDTNPNDGTKYNTVVGGFPVGRNPQLIVFSSDGTKAYISSAGDNTVYVVANGNPADPSSKAIPLGPQATSLEGITLSPDGRTLVVTAINTGNIAVIDTSSYNVSFYAVGNGPTWVTYNSDGSRVYVTNQNDNDVAVLDSTSFSLLRTVPVGSHPLGVACKQPSASGPGSLASGFGYVSNNSAGSISMFDVASNSVVANINVGTNPVGVAVTQDGASLYVGVQGLNEVALIDTNQRRFVTSIPVGHQPTGVALTPDGARAYVADRGDNTVSVIDTVSNAVIATVPVGQYPQLLSVSPDGSRVYVANTNDASVSVIDTASNTVVSTILGLGSAPTGIHFSPDGTLVYVADQGGALSIINVASATLVNNLPVQGVPIDVAITPDGKRLYISNAVSFSQLGTSVLDAGTFAQLGFIPMSAGAAGVVMTPDGSRVYAAVVTGSVSVINSGTNSVTNTFPVGSGASFIALGKSPSQTVATGTGTNVTTSVNGVSITFSGVSAPGSTTVTNIPAFEAGSTPSGYTILNFAWELTTTAAYTVPLTVCFQVPLITDSTTFSNLRVLHNVNGTLMDQTILSGPNAPDFTTHTICAQTNSLSPFVIAQPAPSSIQSTFASISAVPITYGTTAVINVSVNTNTGQPASGNVSLTVDGFSQPTQALSNGGTTFSISGLSAGLHSFSVDFPSQGNFGSSNATASITVSQASLVISANNAPRVYGAQNPTFTGSITGLQNGDSITATFTSAGVPSSPVGQFPITATLADPNSRLGNYAVTYNNGTLIITAAPLTISTNAATKVLNAPNPSFSAFYTGFVLGQTSTVLSGSLSCTSTATTTSPVGSYPITCSGQTSTNYAITYTPATLTIIYATGGLCDGDTGHQILQPINADGSSVWKQGSTVPAKFRVCDSNGVSIGIPGVVTAFTLYKVVAGTVTSIDEVPTSSSTDTAFRWDPSGMQWIYNISTKLAPVNSAPATYFFRIDLNDGTSIYFNFGLR